MKTGESKETASPSGWTFLSNHAHVLLLIKADPEIKLRDVALRVGITERAVQRIVADLEAGKYLERHRAGRRNQYRIHADLPLRHPLEADTRIGDILDLILQNASAGTPKVPARPRKKTSENSGAGPSR
jgi:hypothetical protein